MDYQVSARKYRPATFQDVIGQPHVVQTLMNGIASERIAHAFLFSGSRGVGKTTVARILAKALNCEQGPTSTPCGTCLNCAEITQGTSVDVIEIDGASNTSVDDVREIRENVKFTPFRGHYRVYIIDEVHMLSNSAFNALLKTLEEPPAHVVFVFATTEIHKIPATILSRCQHYNFRRIPSLEIMQRLRYVADQDGIQIEDRTLTAIARASEGSMRDALSLLDQAISFAGDRIRHEDVERLLGSVPHELVRTMTAAVLGHDSRTAIRLIGQLLDRGHDVRAFCGELVEHARNLLVASVLPDGDTHEGLKGLVDLSDEELRELVDDARSVSPDRVQDLFRIFSEAEDALRSSARPRFVLEVAAVRAARLGAPATASALPAARPATAPVPQRGASRGTATPQSILPSSTAPTPVPTGRPPVPSRSTTAPGRPVRPPEAPQGAAGPRTNGSSTLEQRAEGATPSATAVAVSVPEGRTTAQISLNWEQVVERVEQRHPSIGPFLAMACLIGFEGRDLTIGYPHTASIALARVQKDDSLRAISEICTECIGLPVRVRVVELGEGQSSGPSVSESRANKERIQKQSLLVETRAHPLVKQALALFGGDVIEVRRTTVREETG
ncbi:DNA polymerase III subunit gamma/tau [Candidatus Nitrospira bockiana]